MTVHETPDHAFKTGSTRAISCILVRIAPKYVGSVIVHRFPGHSSLQSLHKLFDISQQSMTLVLGWLLALFLGRLSPQSAGQPELSLKTNSNVFSFPSHPHLPSTDEPSSVFISAPFIPSPCRKWEDSVTQLHTLTLTNRGVPLILGGPQVWIRGFHAEKKFRANLWSGVGYFGKEILM